MRLSNLVPVIALLENIHAIANDNVTADMDITINAVSENNAIKSPFARHCMSAVSKHCYDVPLEHGQCRNVKDPSKYGDVGSYIFLDSTEEWYCHIFEAENCNYDAPKPFNRRKWFKTYVVDSWLYVWWFRSYVCWLPERLAEEMKSNTGAGVILTELGETDPGDELVEYSQSQMERRSIGGFTTVTVASRG